MPVGGVDKTEGVRIERMRTEQRRAEEARTQDQQRVNQNNREVSETRRTAETGRGETMDVTA